MSCHGTVGGLEQSVAARSHTKPGITCYCFVSSFAKGILSSSQRFKQGLPGYVSPYQHPKKPLINKYKSGRVRRQIRPAAARLQPLLFQQQHVQPQLQQHLTSWAKSPCWVLKPVQSKTAPILIFYFKKGLLYEALTLSHLSNPLSQILSKTKDLNKNMELKFITQCNLLFEYWLLSWAWD